MSLFGCSSTGRRGSVARKVGNTAFAVKWSDKEENEANVQYVQRGLLRKPALGLVVGRRQLGERVDQANGVVIRSWRLPNTPQEWTQDTVKESLNASVPDDPQEQGDLVSEGCLQGGRQSASGD